MLSGLPGLLLLLLAGALALRSDPQSEMRAARRLLLAGRPHDALLAYQQLYERGERRPELLLQLAQLRLIRGEAGEAEILLVEALDGGLAPREVGWARLCYGWALALRERYDAALLVWSELPDAERGTALVLEGESYLRRGDVRAARAALERAQAQQLAPAWRAQASYRLVQLLGGAELPAARAALAQASAYAPERWELLPLTAGLAELGQQRLADLAQALEVPAPRRPVIMASLLGKEGLLLAALGLLDQSGVAFDEEMVIFDATLRRRYGDLSGALRQLEQLGERFPASAMLLRMRGLLEVERDPARARELLAAASALDPLSPDNLILQALILRADGDYVAASEAYEQAITQALPERLPLYHLHATRFYFDTTFKQCGAGLEHAQAAAEGLPDDREAAILLGELLLRCDKVADAARHGDELSRRWPAEPEGHYLRGLALFRLGFVAEGRKSLLDVANLAPASSWRERAELVLAGG